MPPEGEPDSVMVNPAQTVLGPVMEGSGFTVSVAVVKQPPPSEYVIVVVPADMPVTMPEDEPMVATDGLLLLHVPPGVALVMVMVPSTHTWHIDVPDDAHDIGAGAVIIFTDTALKQPVGRV